MLDSRTGQPASLPGPGAARERQVPAQQALPRDPDRDPGPLLQRRRLAVLPGHAASSSTGSWSDYIPDGEFSPIWNPEFFGNTIIVNGNTWPFQTVEQRRYRFRFLNGCQSRFLILDFDEIPGVEVWQIGNEGGFLAAPVEPHRRPRQPAADGPGRAGRRDRRLHQRARRATTCSRNVGPDEPFGGGDPGDDFDVADPDTTGQVMQFRVVPAVDADDSTPPQFLQLPAITPLPAATAHAAAGADREGGRGCRRRRRGGRGPGRGAPRHGRPTRRLDGAQVDGPRDREPRRRRDRDLGDLQHHRPTPTRCTSTRSSSRSSTARASSSTRTGEVVEPIQLDGDVTPPEPWETGFKDTVIAYPGQVTRVGPGSRRRASSSGTATSSSTRTTR